MSSHSQSIAATQLGHSQVLKTQNTCMLIEKLVSPCNPVCTMVVTFWPSACRQCDSEKEMNWIELHKINHKLGKYCIIIEVPTHFIKLNVIHASGGRTCCTEYKFFINHMLRIFFMKSMCIPYCFLIRIHVSTKTATEVKLQIMTKSTTAWSKLVLLCQYSTALGFLSTLSCSCVCVCA